MRSGRLGGGGGDGVRMVGVGVAMFAEIGSIFFWELELIVLCYWKVGTPFWKEILEISQGEM